MALLLRTLRRELGLRWSGHRGDSILFAMRVGAALSAVDVDVRSWVLLEGFFLKPVVF
ncbi:hypothetical protein [uncultured Deefgea sp.]|uniref:hypothetical protein n=1 Tax=uncultured Deefgea sp. TaxID=1304914 RepID=UPI00260F38C6|nr:hypothetical protein [uncultured Deefgea sp.]